MYDEIIDALLKMVQLYTTYQVVLGSNPTKESIAITGFGAPIQTYKDKDTNQVLNITINGKSASQNKLLKDLTKIHRAITMRADFPQGENWHIYSIETTASPRLVAVEEAEKNKWIYGSSLLVKFYQLGLKGDINNA